MRSCARFRFATFCNSFRERRVNGGITETKVPYPPYPCLPRIAESGRRARAGRARDRLICQEAAQCVDMPRRSIPAWPKSTERPDTSRLRQRDQFRDTDDRNLDCPRNGGRRHRSTPGMVIERAIALLRAPGGDYGAHAQRRRNSARGRRSARRAARRLLSNLAIARRKEAAAPAAVRRVLRTEPSVSMMVRGSTA